MYIYIYLPIYLSIYLSINLSIYLSIKGDTYNWEVWGAKGFGQLINHTRTLPSSGPGSRAQHQSRDYKWQLFEPGSAAEFGDVGIGLHRDYSGLYRDNG